MEGDIMNNWGKILQKSTPGICVYLSMTMQEQWQPSLLITNTHLFPIKVYCVGRSLICRSWNTCLLFISVNSLRIEFCRKVSVSCVFMLINPSVTGDPISNWSKISCSSLLSWLKAWPLSWYCKSYHQV